MRALTLQQALARIVSKKLTVPKLASYLGVHHTTVYSWGRGDVKKVVNKQVASKLLDLLEAEGIASAQLTGSIPKVLENTTAEQRKQIERDSAPTGKSYAMEASVGNADKTFKFRRRQPKGATHTIGDEYVRIVPSPTTGKEMYLIDWGDGWQSSSWVKENRRKAKRIVK